MRRTALPLALLALLLGCRQDSPALAELREAPPADPFRPVAAGEIAGRKWVVDGLSPSAANAFAWSRLGISLALDSATGTASGFAGCNRWSAPFTSAAPGELRLGPARATRMACAAPEGVMQREAEFLAALPTVRGMTRSEDQLRLEREDGGRIVLILDDG